MHGSKICGGQRASIYPCMGAQVESSRWVCQQCSASMLSCWRRPGRHSTTTIRWSQKGHTQRPVLRAGQLCRRHTLPRHTAMQGAWTAKNGLAPQGQIANLQRRMERTAGAAQRVQQGHAASASTPTMRITLFNLISLYSYSRRAPAGRWRAAAVQCRRRHRPRRSRRWPPATARGAAAAARCPQILWRR